MCRRPFGNGNFGSVPGNSLSTVDKAVYSRPGLGQGIWRTSMLWTITIILLVLWLIGFVGFHVVGWWIHLLLILAIISLIFNLIGGRRAI